MAIRVLQGKSVLVGVSGSIAAYKACSLVSSLVRGGARVHVLMTPAAKAFVGPLSFHTLSGQPVCHDVLELLPDGRMAHIALAEEAQAMVLAPATANLLARLALGLAEDPVSTTALVSRAPLLLAPAMETAMWSHPATQENLARLEERGALILPPREGRLASGREGPGRMVEAEEIVDALRWVLGSRGDLAGRKVVVTGGATREQLDPLRFISNPSSGLMGYALAQAARDRGAEVVHLTAPLDLPPLAGVTRREVGDAAALGAALADALPGSQLLIMSAAVSDFRPVRRAEHKVRRSKGSWTLELEPTEDILAGVKMDGLVKVGFAAETEELVEGARRKLREKGLDLIVANPAPDSFGGTHSQVTILGREGEPAALPPLPKEEVAWRVLDRAIELLRAGPA